MPLLDLIILAVVQGLAELLPVSSSAHVIMAEKFLHLDPTSPEMTLVLVLLHTGTMFAVIVYFWRRWVDVYFRDPAVRRESLTFIVIATTVTVGVGLILQKVIKHLLAHGNPDFEIEQLFSNTKLIAVALAAAGVFIIISSFRARQASGRLSGLSSAIIGAVQGLCLPFRGFSRSGATISAGLLLGVARQRAEEFSFALAVVLTPPVVIKELLRVAKHHGFSAAHGGAMHALAPGALGMVFSFFAGLAALRWLSSWLENGRWHYFGIYCLAASVFVWFAAA